MPLLTLTFNPEDEWHGEVIASIESADYAGRSSAWFNVNEIRSFCAALEAFPISADAPPKLIGGFWKDTADEIEQAHLSLVIAPRDQKGGLVVSVRLSTPVWKSEHDDLCHAVVAHFVTDYPSLDRFRASLLDVVAAQADVAMLDGH